MRTERDTPIWTCLSDRIFCRIFLGFYRDFVSDFTEFDVAARRQDRGHDAARDHTDDVRKSGENQTDADEASVQGLSELFR